MQWVRGVGRAGTPYTSTQDHKQGYEGLRPNSIVKTVEKHDWVYTGMDTGTDTGTGTGTGTTMSRYGSTHGRSIVKTVEKLGVSVWIG